MVILCYYPYPLDEDLHWCFDLPLDLLFKQDCENLSVDEFTENSLSMFPNPVDEILSIKSNSGNLNIRSITVYDLNGTQVAIKKGTYLNSIDLSQLSSGIYFCEIDSDRGSIVKKIIKQ